MLVCVCHTSDKILCDFNKHFPVFVPSVIITCILTYSFADRKSMGLITPAHGLENFERYVTLLFMHSDEAHLLNNMLCLLAIGTTMEVFHGALRISVLYLWSGVVSSMAQAYTSRNESPAIFVGASPAIFAIAGGHVGNLLLNYDVMPYRLLRLCILTIYGVSEILFTVYRDKSDRIAWQSHAFGFGMGSFVGAFVLKNMEKRKCETFIKPLSAAVSIAWTITVFILKSTN